MKKLLLAGVAVLSVLSASAAHAGTRTIKLPTVTVTSYSTSLPPAEYDVPYTGELIIWVVQSKRDLRETYCAWTAAHQENWAGTACTSLSKSKQKCIIFIGTDAVLKATHGMTRSIA